ncbi:hypothetical protein VMCG_04166 [Cytospora schulzeri]|uniref:AA1-like domain-containing protein n=1 Tax=Cytospora schulzeri TaxID=448051 RepID=A0A423WU15_9PEZI|nr:hypothetical protein VMCG_04166 [Valsa malicola]
MHRLAISLLAAAASYTCGSPVPSRDTSTGCSKASFSNFAWTVETFDFHASYVFTTPAHQNSYGFVDFNLTNPALPDLLASCTAQSSQLSEFFYGNLPYNCTFNGELGEPGPAPAKFTFSRSTGELDINQTWTCDDDDPQYPTTFSASGKANLTLDCTDTTWQNANWTLGQIYSDRVIQCAPVTVDVEPYQVSAVA